MSEPESKTATGIGFGCVTLFALPFAGFGLFAMWQIGSMLWLAVETRSWVETPATIKSVELKVYSSSDGGDTYEVLANYEYEYNGARYTGDRVGLASEPDNLRRYHKRVFNRIERAKDGKARASCYVDPDDPARSVLIRELRLTSVVFFIPFAIGFSFIGFGLLLGAVYAYGKMREARKLEAAEPDRPWLWREDWKRGLVESTGRDRLLAIGYGALFWNSIAWPIALIFYSGDSDAEWWGIAIVSIFPAVGVWLIGWWVYVLVQRKRYGESTLQLATLPGVVGGRFAGAILAPAALQGAERIRISLACSHTTGSGDNRKTRVVWKDERVVRKALDAGEAGRVGLPVAFVVPSECLQTEEGVVEWKLKAKAKLPGVDYDAEFFVPIFRTEESRDDVDPDGEPLTEYEETVPLGLLLAEQGILAQELGTLGGHRFAAPAGRKCLATVVLSFFTLLFGGIGVGLFVNSMWMFGAAFAFFGVLLVFATLDTWLGQSELRITPVGWQSQNGWWGMMPAPTKFIAENIQSIEAEKSGSTGDQIDYRVVAYLPGDERVVLVRGVRGPMASRQLVDHLREIAGIDTEKSKG